MNTLIFHSVEELQKYLRNAPDDEVIRITVTNEDADEENIDGREEDGKD